MHRQTHPAVQSAPPSDPDRIVRFNEFCRLCGIGRTTAYNLIRSGALEPPLKLGPRACGWRRSTLDAFLNSRAQARGAE